MEKFPNNCPGDEAGRREPSKWDILEERDDTEPSWARRSDYVAADAAPFLLTEYSDEELAKDPVLRFNVNPSKFPIFVNQYIYVPATGKDAGKDADKVFLDINETLGYMVSAAADTIAYLAGEDGRQSGSADAVIYLDKSARPVSWLVDEMWDDFTEKPRPARQHFLLIDRTPWLSKVGFPVDKDGCLEEDYGANKKSTRVDSGMFLRNVQQHPIPRSELARIRLALIPGGAKALRDSLSGEELEAFNKYNPLHSADRSATLPELPGWLTERIFAIPTGLEGKNIAIIDEVSGSGATIGIAKYLIEKAVNFPDTKVSTHIFWNSRGEVAPTVKLDNGLDLMASVPAWYSHDDKNPELGKGVGDLNFAALSKEFQDDPSFENLTRLYAANVTGRRLNMDAKEGESSQELKKEFKRMAELYRSGHIFMPQVRDYDLDKWYDTMEQLGVDLAQGESLNLRNPRSRASILAKFSANRHS